MHYFLPDPAALDDQFGDFFTMNNIRSVSLALEDVQLGVRDRLRDMAGFLFRDHVPAPREHDRVRFDPPEHVVADPGLVQHEGELGVGLYKIHDPNQQAQRKLDPVRRKVCPAGDEGGDAVRLRGRQQPHDAAVAEAVEDRVPKVQRLQKGQHVRRHVAVVQRPFPALPMAAGVEGVAAEAFLQEEQGLVENRVVLPVAVHEDQRTRVFRSALFVIQIDAVYIDHHMVCLPA